MGTPEKASYAERTMTSIREQCARRAIEDVEDFVSFIGLPTPILEMDDVRLRSLNRALPRIFEEYLEGEKRLPR